MDEIYIDFLEDPSIAGYETCETCGHWSRHDFTLYEHEGEPYVEYRDEVSCTDWIDFNGSVKEFTEWLAKTNHYIEPEVLEQIKHVID